MRHLLRLTLAVTALSFFAPTQPVRAVDHSTFDTLLDKYVEGGYFDYGRLVNNPDDVARLEEYRREMSRVKPSEHPRDEALAYWINLYNASTIHLIVKNYPVDSIRDLGGWVSSVFDKQFIRTTRGTLSLDTVEHGIIRPKYDEPRIHFALVCAAKSCPPLRSEAYTGPELDRQLEEQTEEFLESNMNQFTVDKGSLSLELSSILYWYQEDFGGESGVADYVRDYLPANQAKLIEEGDYSISFRDYDWSLNQAPGPYDLN